MNPLDTLIRQHVVQVAKAAGFTTKGRTFRLAATNGDHLLMHFDTHKVDPERHVFDVTFWIVPLPHWEFLTRQDVAPSAPGVSGALATYPAIPRLPASPTIPRRRCRSDPAGLSRSRTREICADGNWLVS